MPLAVGFAVFKTKEPAATQGKRGESWVLIDPDMFEEDLCEETITVLLDRAGGKTQLFGVEKVGGTVLGRNQMANLIDQAEKRWLEWSNTLKG
jgi:exosome complex component RRP43